MASGKSISKRMAKASKTNSKRVHIISRLNGEWAVKKEGKLKAFKILPTQKAAISIAKDLVTIGKATKIVIHSKTGKIRKR